MSYLTIIMCGSNEGYAGDFLGRMQRSVDSIFVRGAHHKLDAELLLVEWGTPPERPLICNTLNWSRAKMPVRAVLVPKEFIGKIPNPYGIRFLEPWAKSVGVRRATGKFILTTNADAVFSDELIARLARHDLNPQCVYRANRYDCNRDGHVQQIQRANGTFTPGERYTGLTKTDAEYSEDMPHFNAAGEFILMSRASYHGVHGWPELPYWAHVDSMVLHLALSRGLKQVVLPEPLYHQYHEHDHRRHPFRPDWSDGKPWSVKNGENWGFKGVEFLERMLHEVANPDSHSA